jgi:transforming growth factor-beta-induced protein
MSIHKFYLVAAGCALLGGTAVAQPPCQQSQHRTTVSIQHHDDKRASILETAARAGQFKTLTTALLAAELDGALRGSGPFTVFAPSDAAFAKLPAGTLESLLQPENKSKLQDILKYHVVPGRVLAQDAAKVNSTKTLLGRERLAITSNTGIKINNASVTKADILCSNGVIHVIDTVLLPATASSESSPRRSNGILAVAEKAGNFKTLLAALQATGLDAALEQEGPFTVFAPTDDAFAKLPAKTLKKLLTPEGKEDLANILKYHVLAGKSVSARDAVAAGRANTLQGSKVHIDIRNGQVTINNAKTVVTDIKTSNGIIHVIDTVLLLN